MDKLKIGALERLGDVHFTTCQVEGITLPALELRLEGGIDQPLLEALEAGELEIYGQDGLRQGAYSGYGKVVRKSVVVAKVSDDQQELIRLKAQLAALEQEMAAKSL